MNRSSRRPPVDILGLKVMPLHVKDLNESLLSIIRAKGHTIVPSVNIHYANLAFLHPWMREFYNSAALNFCDGAGIILGAWLLGKRIPERITYADWMWDFAEFAQKHGIRFYFLGGVEGAARETAERLKERFPGLQVVGIRHGYFTKTAGGAENEQVIAEINRCRPDVLFVAFGMPLQEMWLKENWGWLDARVALTGGAVFEYISGRLRRPPRWMRRLGLEWLGRLLIEPWRLWKRYLIGNPLFLWRIVKQKLGQAGKKMAGSV